METQMLVTDENSVQKFTDEDSVQGILRSVHKLTPEHISLLSQDKKEELSYYIKHMLNQLDGEAYEAFYFKIKDVMTDKFKNVTWDRNHERIKDVIKSYVINYKKMPTVSMVADIAQMSRVTVSKHLKEFDLLDYSGEQKQMFTIMFNDVMGQVLAKAISGDFSSIKLFAEVMMKSGDNSKTIFKAKNQQNNFIVES